MPTSFPGSLDTFTNPLATDDLETVDHAAQHGSVNDAVEAVETKLGTGASTPTTAGHVLTVTSAGATAYQAGGASVVLRQRAASAGAWFIAGRYYDGSMEGSGTVSTSLIVDRLYFVPMYTSTAISLDRIGINVLAAGGTLARLGIYDSNSSGQPSSLILDAGTVATNAIAAVEITISQTLSADTTYWLAIVANGAPSIHHKIHAASANFGATAIGISGHSRLYASFTFGALPANTNALTFDLDGANVPRISVRIA